MPLIADRRFALLAVTLTYVTVTVGESILAPLLPLAAPELGLDTAAGGAILAVLSLGTAVGNLAGGLLLGRAGPKAASLVGVGLSTVGASLAAGTRGVPLFVAAHALIGLGAGGFFAAGIFSVGRLADPRRLGRAMGAYGIAFSLALALAAGLVALVGPEVWRRVFVAASGLGVLSLATLAVSRLPGPVREVERGRPSPALLGVPVAVGGVAAVAQFGLVAFIPTYAVDGWTMTAAAAASVLLGGRLLSIPGKAVAGRIVDEIGAVRAARLVGAALVGCGLVWVGSPWPVIGTVGAVAFAAGASAMFPIANVVALERFGGRGDLLGAFRSAQMLVAAVSAWLVGLGASTLGLRTTLLIGVVGLLAVLAIGEQR